MSGSVGGILPSAVILGLAATVALMLTVSRSWAAEGTTHAPITAAIPGTSANRQAARGARTP